MLSKLKQLTEELYDEINDFIKNGRYAKYLSSLVQKQYSF